MRPLKQTPKSNAGRLIVYDREMHLEPRRRLVVGDTLEIIRGNGPRKGDSMGTAILTRSEDGTPMIDIPFAVLELRFEDESEVVVPGGDE
jgi:hypothetical protein